MNWGQIVSDLGLPDLIRHGLRHTGATWMADAGIPLHVLQDILGLASVETTRGYLHPDDRQGAGRRFPRPIRQGQQTEPARGLEVTVTGSREPRSGALVPIWSTYPQATSSTEPGMPSGACEPVAMPWRGDQSGTNKNPSPHMTRPR
ncbi:site-specific integrase [Micrococcus luteus]|uniref:site-specific integrase n=1 Tax=Micrococcus luteus TaxID=1270 RepID=UPI0021D52854|nr:site-specific integrase [Micrococcus luteus]